MKKSVEKGRLKIQNLSEKTKPEQKSFVTKIGT